MRGRMRGKKEKVHWTRRKRRKLGEGRRNGRRRRRRIGRKRKRKKRRRRRRLGLSHQRQSMQLGPYHSNIFEYRSNKNNPQKYIAVYLIS